MAARKAKPTRATTQSGPARSPKPKADRAQGVPAADPATTPAEASTGSKPAGAESPQPARKGSPGAAAGAGETTAPASAMEPKATHEQIAIEAYRLWEEEGRPSGQAERYWLEAERQLARSTH